MVSEKNSIGLTIFNAQFERNRSSTEDGYRYTMTVLKDFLETWNKLAWAWHISINQAQAWNL